MKNQRDIDFSYWIRTMQLRHADLIPNAKREQSDTKAAKVAVLRLSDVGASFTAYAPHAPSEGYKKADEPYNGMLDFLVADMELGHENRLRMLAKSIQVQTTEDRAEQTRSREKKRREREKASRIKRAS